MTSTARTVAAGLLRASLVAAVLTIIFGIFGMHVMTGNDAAHGDHTAAVQVAVGHAGPGHADTRHVGAFHTDTGHVGAVHTVAADTTFCAGSCHRTQESGASCIPSAKAGALTVFPPHESGLVLRAGPGTSTGPAAANAHTPPSPTPCELSISRT